MLYCWRDPGDPRGESSAPPVSHYSYREWGGIKNTRQKSWISFAFLFTTQDVSTDYDDEKKNKRETLRRRKSRSALESNCQSDVGVIPQEVSLDWKRIFVFFCLFKGLMMIINAIARNLFAIK